MSSYYLSGIVQSAKEVVIHKVCPYKNKILMKKQINTDSGKCCKTNQEGVVAIESN